MTINTLGCEEQDWFSGAILIVTSQNTEKNLGPASETGTVTTDSLIIIVSL